MLIFMLITLCSAGVWLFLILSHGRFYSSDQELLNETPELFAKDAFVPAVDIIIPARNEAEVIRPVIRSLILQNYPGRVRIFLTDDQSTDNTGELARQAALQALAERALVLQPHQASGFAPSPSLTIVDGALRPEGKSGKVWAMMQSYQASAQTDIGQPSEYLLFTDADIGHEPGHLSALVSKALKDQCEMVSEMVHLRVETPAEKFLIPAFIYFFQLLYPFDRVNNPHDKTAAAAGGTMLVKREALEKAGGLEKISTALIDDVSLAKLIKHHGKTDKNSSAPFAKIWLGHATAAESLRPYEGPRDIWNMIARTAFVQLNYSAFLLVATLLGLAFVWLTPIAAVLFGGFWTRIFGLIAWFLAAGTFLPTLNRYQRSPFLSFTLPVVAVFYMAATCGSAFNHWFGQGVSWKKRAYGDQS